jgi:hypothetical protein
MKNSETSSKISMMKKLILIVAMCVGSAAAHASTDGVWADSVRSASRLAETAQGEILKSHDCVGLKGILVLGASESGKGSSDSLGSLRVALMSLDVVAAEVQFATVAADDPAKQQAASEAHQEILKYKAGVDKTLEDKVYGRLDARLNFCGNGVEK